MGRKLTLWLLLTVLLPLSLSAEKAQDFVSRLLGNLEGQYSAADNEDYACITVSPSMMDKMLKMLQSSERKDDEQIQRILPHIKSMRIFSATKHEERYNQAARKLLKDYPKSYKPFRVDTSKTATPCVWIRKSGSKVVEMIVVNAKDDNGLQIINITGDMNKEFVNELLKM